MAANLPQQQTDPSLDFSALVALLPEQGGEYPSPQR